MTTPAGPRLVCDLPPMPLGQQCAVCGCTDDDCSKCVVRTGSPCYWAAINLCSACVDDVEPFAP